MKSLTMDGDGVANVALSLGRNSSSLGAAPESGATVRFTGVMRQFTQEPFVLTFEVEQVSVVE